MLMPRIIPVTKARSSLSDLTLSVKGDDYVVLTKGGSPKAALVALDYLTKLEEAVRKLYQPTFMTPKLIPYTRKFTDSEINEWQQEDAL